MYERKCITAAHKNIKNPNVKSYWTLKA